MVGMSQEKLGEHLGITFQQIQKYEGYESHRREPLQQISTTLGVPVAFFFEGAPTVGPEGEGFSEGSPRPTSSTSSPRPTD